MTPARSALPAPHLERTPPSVAVQKAAARTMDISLGLRERAGWRITGASFARSWALRLEGTTYRISALASAFFGGPKAPTFVFGASFYSARKHPAFEPLLASSWFKRLHGRLGDAHAPHVTDTSVYVGSGVRGITDPKRVLRVFGRFVNAVEGGPLRRPYPLTPDEGRDAPEDLWNVIERLRASEWTLYSTSQSLERRLRRDGAGWRAFSSFAPIVDSREGPPGFISSVGCWSKKAKGTNPIGKADRLLRGAGYEFVADDHRHRFQRGLSGRAAKREILLLEDAMDRMSA